MPKLDNNGQMTTNNAEFVSEQVRKRRMELGLNQEVSSAGGPSRTVMSQAERKGILPKSASVQRKFCRVLKWQLDAVERLERGEVPLEAADSLTHDEIRAVVRTMRYALDSLEARLDADSPR